MSLADVVLVVMWLGLTAYALSGGADFGAGWWDLVAGGPRRGAAQRALIEHSIGPIWEANHVWLIFVLVVLWTGFPTAFAAVMSTLYIPLTLAGVGIVLRGSAFAFRKAVPGVPLKRVFGAAFASSSVITPFFFGTVAGGVASGRVPAGNATGDVIDSWWNPTSVLGGVLAVGVCAYLAAVYLCRDAQREDAARAEDVTSADESEPSLAEVFRRRALVTGLIVGVVAMAGVLVLRSDARDLYDGLVGRALPLMVVSALAGIASLALLARRAYVPARASAALAVTAVLWGWGAGQYPYLLERTVTVEDAAADPAALRPLLVVLLIAIAIVVPSLVLLYRMFQQPAPPSHAP